MLNILDFYSRKDIQKEIVRAAKDREIAVKFGDKGFGKRPDIIQYESDVIELAKQGVTSFHASEERWINPLELKPGMSKKQLDDLRKGWDFIIDIDCKFIEYSKITADFLIKALKFNGVKNISAKFSVTGDTPILIKLGNNIDLIPIKEVIELVKKGLKLKVLSLNKKGLLSFSKIYDYLIHKNKIYNIYHRQSTLPLRVTGHHSVFSWQNGKIIQKKASKLRVGDYLVSYNTFKNKPNKLPKISYNYTFNGKPVTKKVKITRNIMRLIGYYLADGHITKSIHQTGFTFNVNETSFSDDCKIILKKITKRFISERNPNRGSLQLTMHSKQWYSFFDYFCGKGAKNKHLPSFVWQLPKEYFLELLKGYIRGDGYKRGKTTLVIKSVSKKLLVELTWLCKMHNITCNLATAYNKPHKMPQGTIFKGSFVYVLSFPKKEFPIKEFSNKRKKCDVTPFDKVFPLDGLKLVYKQIKPKKFIPHREEHGILRKQSASLGRIKKVIKWFENYKSINFDKNSLEILNNYKKFYSNDISVLMIKKIKKGKIAKVYDVSVENTESFFGNYYPILLHNSGGTGIHIAVPFESFPKNVHNEEVKYLFPEGARVIAGYLKELIKEPLANKLLEISNINEISKVAKKELLYDKNEFNPYSVVEIDTVLISSRHMFRMPYSLNEKTNLVSIPIDIDKILDFNINDAKIENVKVKNNFLERNGTEDAKQLIYNAFDKQAEKDIKKNKDVTEEKKYQDFKIPKIAIKKHQFPPCINLILSGIKQDGRKRSVFILMNFLQHMGWKLKDIETALLKWNKNNYEPLRDGYILSQLNWSKRQNQKPILPPNCDNESYYRTIGICKPDNWCKKIKNPVNYVTRKLHFQKPRRKK